MSTSPLHDETLHIHNSTYVGDDRQDGHHVEDLLPGSDVARLGGHGPPELSGELPGVHADLQDVVAEGQQRGQGEGGHEQGDETKLDHCRDTEGREEDREADRSN